METNVYTVPEIKNLFIESLLSKVDGKITKISDNSVLSGVGYGVAKINQKGMKDSALIESELFPDYAYGEYLDRVGERSGISSRYRNQGSSVYVRLVGTPSSSYSAAACTFYSSSGISFKLESNFTMPVSGFGYVLLRSVDVGTTTNVDPNTINKVVGAPAGHEYVINEVAAWGGVDVESDDSFRSRILQNFNNFAFDTLSKLKSVLSKLNPLILDVKKIGVDSFGRTILGLITTNGSSLSSIDLAGLIDKSKYYLSLEEQGFTGDLRSDPNLVLQNIPYQYIGLDFRVELKSNTVLSDFRKKIQIQISKYLDFRTWTASRVEWEELLYIIRSQEEVSILPEQFFAPHSDILLSNSSLPRLQGFVMRNLEGDVVLDGGNNIVPVYYTEQYNLDILNQININYGG